MLKIDVSNLIHLDKVCFHRTTTLIDRDPIKLRGGPPIRRFNKQAIVPETRNVKDRLP